MKFLETWMWPMKQDLGVNPDYYPHPGISSLCNSSPTCNSGIAVLYYYSLDGRTMMQGWAWNRDTDRDVG